VSINYPKYEIYPVTIAGILSITPTGVYKEEKPYFSPYKTWLN
jgi:hypothetical protein